MIRKNETRKPQNAQLKEKGRTRKYAAEEKNIEKILKLNCVEELIISYPAKRPTFEKELKKISEPSGVTQAFNPEKGRKR